MASGHEVVLYRYDSSPFSHKVDHILLLKNIPHRRVDVSYVLPRPEITDLLGISYRRIPILAIGNDVYCDTSLISSALERRFPPSAGYGTLFPPRKGGGKSDTGLIKALTSNYAERSIFPHAANLLPWHKMPDFFLKDRTSLQGGSQQIDPKVMLANQPKSKSILSSHLYILEEQLADGREWIFDTELPGLGDITFYFIYAWVKSNRSAGDVFDANKIPKVLEWLSRMATFIKKRKDSGNASFQKLTGDEASQLIASGNYESYIVVGFDSVEAGRLGLQVGGHVSVAPNDTGRGNPTFGRLVALNREEIVIEVKGTAGLVRCHFPRLDFTIQGTPKGQAKL